MKKISMFLAMLFACVLCAPMLFACNGVGNSTVVGVRFTQDVYEADLKVPFNLSYKVYPSTAANYNVTYDFSITDESMYTNNNGEFTIINQACPDIVAYIYIDNTYTDSCTIKLKKYPTSMAFSNATEKINKNGILNLSLNATIGGESKSIGVQDYDIELESTNPSVISVESGLTVASTGKSGSAVVTARIRDKAGRYIMNGNSPMKAQTRVTVIDSVKSATISLEGQSEFINASLNSYTQTDNNTYNVSTNQVVFVVALYSKTGVYINPDDIQITAISSNVDCATIAADVENDKFVVTFVENGTTRIEVSSSATDENGNPVKFIFYLTKG